MSRTFLLLFGLLACSPAKHAPPAEPGATAEDHSDEKEHAELPTGVKVSAELTPQISTAPAKRRALSRTVALNGQLVADPDAIAALGPRISARVVAVKVREGDQVKAGETVLVLTSSELAKLRADLTAARARANAATKNAERVRGLASDRLASEQEALTAEAEATSARAELHAVEQRLRAVGAPPVGGDPSRFVLTSPLPGTVIQRDAIVGQAVTADRSLLTVADLTRAGFQARLFEKDLAGVQEGAPAEVRINGYPDRVYDGKVARISARVDPDERTLTAWISLTHPDARVRLGLFGVAKISLPEPGEPAIVVPLSAVADVGERKVVFVRQPDGDYGLHPVTLGRSASGFVEVLAGLRAGEDVAVRGTHLLRSVLLKASLGEED